MMVLEDQGFLEMFKSGDGNGIKEGLDLVNILVWAEVTSSKLLFDYLIFTMTLKFLQL